MSNKISSLNSLKISKSVKETSAPTPPVRQSSMLNLVEMESFFHLTAGKRLLSASCLSGYSPLSQGQGSCQGSTADPSVSLSLSLSLSLSAPRSLKHLDLHPTVFHKGRQEMTMSPDRRGNTITHRGIMWAKNENEFSFSSTWVSFHSVTKTRVKRLSGS